VESSKPSDSWNVAGMEWIGHTLRRPRYSITRRVLQWNPQEQRKREEVDPRTREEEGFNRR